MDSDLSQTFRWPAPRVSFRHMGLSFLATVEWPRNMPLERGCYTTVHGSGFTADEALNNLGRFLLFPDPFLPDRFGTMEAS